MTAKLLTFFRLWSIAPLATYRYGRHDGLGRIECVCLAVFVIPFFLVLVKELDLKKLEQEFNHALTLTR